MLRSSPRFLKLLMPLLIDLLSLVTIALVLPVRADEPGSRQRYVVQPVHTPTPTPTANTYLELSIEPPIVTTPTPTPVSTSSPSYLELSVEPPIVTTSALVTLHIAYHNIGLPYTYISISPTGLFTFEPPLTMPCKYDQHPNGCTAITLQTHAPGVATFRASATGEVYDESCRCWVWSGAGDNRPASVSIADAIWRMWLPLLHR